MKAQPFFITLLLSVWLLTAASCTQAVSLPPEASSPVSRATEGASPAQGTAAQTPSPARTQTASPAEKPPAATDRSLVSAKNDWFSTAAACDTCHRNLKDASSRDISQAENWRASMMANAARDPYYLASVSLEAAASPEYADAIQDKCSTCHMPMAHFSDAHEGIASLMFGAEGYLSPVHPRHDLAWDGVSCTVCHQIPANPSGVEIKHSGNLDIAFDAPGGERLLYGPYPVDEVGLMIMRGGSGFSPQESNHIRASQLCAACHELYINYIGEDGAISQELFPEQTPYAEWLHSAYAGEASCQSCHMDRAQGKVAISNLTADKKHPHFAIHDFHGGNVYMLSMLQTFGDEIGVQATEENFASLIARTTEELQRNTARLSISPPAAQDDTLTFAITIESLTGHKFPTSFPSRRVWLHVIVKDANGTVVFESGRPAADGSIAGNANDASPDAYEPHYDLITSPDQVQIYEDIMQTPSGEVTTMQMRASGYIKDNRLLPAGFDKATASPYIAVTGAAARDENFTGDGDTLTYRIATGSAPGPFTVQAELLYQAVSYRWEQNTLEHDTPQTEALGIYTQAMENIPLVIASQSVQSP